LICGRCEKETREHKLSMFNTQELCPECQEKEKAHPDYKHACEVERDQALKGNRFFEGIGLPDDMKYKCIIGLRIGTRLCDLKDMAKLVEDITRVCVKEKPHYKIVGYCLTVGNWNKLVGNVKMLKEPFDYLLVHSVENIGPNEDVFNRFKADVERECNIKVKVIC